MPESCWVSLDQSVSHSFVFFGTLLNSTPVSQSGTWISGLRLDHDPPRMTGNRFGLLAPSLRHCCLPRAAATKWLVMLKHRVDDRQNLLAYSHFSRSQTPAPYGTEIKVRLLLLDFLAFCFVHPAQALLNSIPQLLARDRRAIPQGAQLGLGDLWVVAAIAERSGKDQD